MTRGLERFVGDDPDEAHVCTASQLRERLEEGDCVLQLLRRVPTTPVCFFQNSTLSSTTVMFRCHSSFAFSCERTASRAPPSVGVHAPSTCKAITNASGSRDLMALASS